MSAIRVGVDEADHGRHRQAELFGDVTAGHEDRAAACGISRKPPPRRHRSARGNSRVDALAVHFLRVGGGVHVAEADHGFHADVVDRTGDHEVGPAEGDLVDAFFKGDGRGAQAETGWIMLP